MVRKYCISTMSHDLNNPHIQICLEKRGVRSVKDFPLFLSPAPTLTAQKLQKTKLIFYQRHNYNNAITMSTQYWTRLPKEIRQKIIEHFLATKPLNPKLFYGVSYSFGLDDCMRPLEKEIARLAEIQQEIVDSRHAWFSEGREGFRLEGEEQVGDFMIRAQQEVLDKAKGMLIGFANQRLSQIPWGEWEE